MRIRISELRKIIRNVIREAIDQEEFGNENSGGKKELVVLVGPPAVGKSTYIAKKFPKGTVKVISRDDLVEKAVESSGMTYDDLFVTPPAGAKEGETVPGMEKFGKVVKSPAFMTWAPLSYSNVLAINNKVNSELENQMSSIATSDTNVVVDMTNMNAGARTRILSKVGQNDFFKRAVVFKVSDSNLPQLIARAEQRSAAAKAAGKSKTIGKDVIARMVSQFQKIDPSEGFDKVDAVDTFEPGTDQSS